MEIASYQVLVSTCLLVGEYRYGGSDDMYLHGRGVDCDLFVDRYSTPRGGGGQPEHLLPRRPSFTQRQTKQTNKLDKLYLIVNILLYLPPIAKALFCNRITPGNLTERYKEKYGR